MSKRNKWAISNILLGIAATIISIVIVEVLLNFCNYSYTPLHVEVMGNRHDWRFYHTFQDNSFVFDPKLIWKPRKNYSIFNSLGYRGRELDLNKQDNELRIMTIGDSNTLGWNGLNGPNWPNYLEQLFITNEIKVSVINAGVWGYSSFQGLERFKELLQLDPDIVLISFGGNDAHQVFTSDSEYVEVNLAGYKQFIYKYKTGQLLMDFYDKFINTDLMKSDHLTHRVGILEYKNNLIQINDISRKGNILCILLTRPFIGESSNELWWKNYAPNYVKATIQVGTDYNIPVIDVYSQFKDKNEYFVDESHFNEKGHRSLARIIYNKVEPYID